MHIPALLRNGYYAKILCDIVYVSFYAVRHKFCVVLKRINWFSSQRVPYTLYWKSLCLYQIAKTCFYMAEVHLLCLDYEKCHSSIRGYKLRTQVRELQGTKNNKYCNFGCNLRKIEQMKESIMLRCRSESYAVYFVRE